MATANQVARIRGITVDEVLELVRNGELRIDTRDYRAIAVTGIQNVQRFNEQRRKAKEDAANQQA